MDDLYGSPTLDEVALFSRMFAEALEARLGEEVADKLSVEVSSPVSGPRYQHKCADHDLHSVSLFSNYSSNRLNHKRSLFSLYARV